MAFFGISIFLSAFLLFQVEPMIGKYILPWFGGTPAVWSTVMLFFQVGLTGGYAYAYWLIGRRRRAEIIHLMLVGLSLVVMAGLSRYWKSPITPSASLKPGGTFSPVWEIFKLLSISVGLPYFLLASNSPLIQAWFHQAHPDRSAYRLYALSNAGSLIALVTYPVLVEPYLTLTWQGRIWSLAYIVYAGLASFGAVRALRRGLRGAEAGARFKNEPEASAPSGSPKSPARSRSGLQLREYILWIGLAACATTLLLAVTSMITQEVAVIPFLWILPLTIYLLTFILAFSSERWYSRPFFLLVFFMATLLAAWALGRSAALDIWSQIGIYSLLLFTACMVCHGELYRMRPHPSRLTTFYLMVSVGGAVGGAGINFVAPYVFKGFWELPIGLALCWFFFLITSLTIPSPALDRWAGAIATSLPGAWRILSKNRARPSAASPQEPAQGAEGRIHRAAQRSLTVLTQVLLISGFLIAGVRSFQQIHTDLNSELYITRNFYGVVRVRERIYSGPVPIHLGSLGEDITSYHRFAMVHGVTIHGFQFHDSQLKDVPTAYFGATSGGGLAILNHPNRGRAMRVGILGLGVGTLAAYGQKGDVYRFYEINPSVIRLAEGAGGYFTYLSDSQARVEIVPGDARLSLEEELASGHPQNYDVLILDVFSSDSIPVHLLDQEAMAVYLQHLQAEGILAVHISNVHLNLVPVVWTLADYYHLERAVIYDSGDGIVTYQSMWILLARDKALLDVPAIASRTQSMAGYTPGIRMWTDDYNNLIQILKR